MATPLEISRPMVQDRPKSRPSTPRGPDDVLLWSATDIRSQITQEKLGRFLPSPRGGDYSHFAKEQSSGSLVSIDVKPAENDREEDGSPEEEALDVASEFGGPNSCLDSYEQYNFEKQKRKYDRLNSQALLIDVLDPPTYEVAEVYHFSDFAAHSQTRQPLDTRHSDCIPQASAREASKAEPASAQSAPRTHRHDDFGEQGEQVPVPQLNSGPNQANRIPSPRKIGGVMLRIMSRKRSGKTV